MGLMPEFTKKSALPVRDVFNAFSHALRCAYQFAGASAPNPPVGCVLLDAQGRRLADGAHEKAGALHAEALAIEKCRQKGLIERIHTVVVTLEPCNHSGRTPPCTQAILSTPAREVWIGVCDPNRAVCGNGVKTLVDGGLRVKFIPELEERGAAALAFSAQRLIGPFAKHVRTTQPWVTIKQALNGAGNMIPEPGQKTFTSASSLNYAHRLRKRADAILTGSGTVLADNPQFSVRHVPDFAGKKRFLVIMDRRKRVADNYLKAAARRGFTVWVERELAGALKKLGRAGAQEVLVEAGPNLVASLLATNLWDEHITIKAGDGADVISSRYSLAFDKQFSERRTAHVFRDY